MRKAAITLLEIALLVPVVLLPVAGGQGGVRDAPVVCHDGFQERKLPAALEYGPGRDLSSERQPCCRRLPGKQCLGGGVAPEGEDIGARYGEVWTYTYGKYLVTYLFTFRKPSEWRLLDRITGNQFRGELEARSREEDYGISDLEAYKAELEKLKK